MNKDKKIVFMGTPQFAVEALKKIHESNHQVVGVVCPPDKPSGRGHKLKSCEVKKYGVSQNLNILQPEKLKCPKFLHELNNLNADIFIVVAFRMLPKEVWSIPKYGTFNIHASLLPQYRGAAPINWALINGEKKTGVTSFLIDEKIDTGAILLYKECIIGKNENVGELHDRLMHMGAELTIKTCEGIFNNKIEPRTQQNIPKIKYAPKLFKNDCKIDWSKSSLEIYNHIRGLSPYPVAWTNIISNNESKTIKIFNADFTLINHKKEITEIDVNKNSLKIYTKDGFINILEIQIAGKKKMDIQSFLNGINIKSFKKVS
tara:strand:+ start:1742 stop:2692 length:951 start_codon:yes stop_codon:yes gene_type:complete